MLCRPPQWKGEFSSPIDLTGLPEKNGRSLASAFHWGNANVGIRNARKEKKNGGSTYLPPQWGKDGTTTTSPSAQESHLLH